MNMKGYSFLLNDDSNSHHLYFVISDPDPDNNVLLVNMTTIYSGVYHDSSCELNRSDHPFVQHPSYITYKDAREVQQEIILNNVMKHVYIRQEDASIGLLSKIQRGAVSSDFLPEKFIKYFDFF